MEGVERGVGRGNCVPDPELGEGVETMLEGSTRALTRAPRGVADEDDGPADEDGEGASEICEAT